MMPNAFTPDRDLVNQSGLPLAGGEA